MSDINYILIYIMKLFLSFKQILILIYFYHHDFTNFNNRFNLNSLFCGK